MVDIVLGSYKPLLTYNSPKVVTRILIYSLV